MAEPPAQPNATATEGAARRADQPPTDPAAYAALPHGVAGNSLVETAFRSRERRTGPEDDDDVFSAANFRQVQNSWWVDRVLPGGVLSFLLAIWAACTAVWLLGLGLHLVAHGLSVQTLLGFLRSREWQMQPAVLFIHLLCLRLFKGIYSRNFERAFRSLDVTKVELSRYYRTFFGQGANFGALAIAAPFIAYRSFVYFPSDRLLVDYNLAERGAEAWLLLLLWNFEWLMFGYFCWLMAMGAVVTWRLLKRHHFIDSIDLVLAERQYRPLFALTAQGGSLVFLLALVQTAYVFYTSASVGEYVGLGVLVVLLISSFAVTFYGVRSELTWGLSGVTASLEASYRRSRERLSSLKDVPGIEDDLVRIQLQLKMALALQQLAYVNEKFEEVGRRELVSVLLKMLAPVGGAVARVIRWGSLLAALGLGGFALSQSGGEKTEKAPAQNAARP